MTKLSLRSIAKELDLSHSTLSKILNGKYNADPKKVVDKLIGLLGGVHIPESRYDEILQFLESARLPAKFSASHRAATWLYETISDAKKRRGSDVP